MFQLSFLNTGLLIFAAATILPLIIWLLAKKKPPQIIFSSIRFIKKTEKEQKSRTQIKNIILLIIRMLIILLLVLAASRPSLRIPNFKPGKKHPPTAVAIVLDTSFSMEYTSDSKSNLEKAKAAILQINNKFTTNDLTVLITSDENWNRMNSQLQSGKLSENLVNSIQSTWLPLSMDKVLEFAETKLKESQYSNKEIFLISDYQAMSLPAQMSIPVLMIKPFETSSWENLSVSNARPVMELTSKQRIINISFDITNHGSSVRRDVLVRADFNGQRSAEKFITLQPGQKQTETLPVEITSSGWQTGYIEVLDERLTADNRSWFTFQYELHPSVGVITQRGSLPLIMQTMLSVFATPQGSVKLISPNQVNLQQINNFTVLVVYDAGELTPRLREFLQTCIKTGKGVLYAADANLKADWKTYFSQLMGINLQQFNNASGPISFVNPYHSITSIIDSRQLSRTSISDFWVSAGSGNSNILLASEGAALAVVNASNSLWLFDVASVRNRFFLEASFPVFAFRSLQYLANASFENEQLIVGHLLAADEVILPDGGRTELSNTSFKTFEPGIYQLNWRQYGSGFTAIQPELSESDFQPMQPPKASIYHSLGDNWQNQLFLSRLGHDIWKYLLWIVLFLFLLEIIIVKSEEWKAGSTKS